MGKKSAAELKVSETNKADCCAEQARCNTYACPGGFKLKEHASDLLCSYTECTDADAGVCCERSKEDDTEAEETTQAEIECRKPDVCEKYDYGWWLNAQGD